MLTFALLLAATAPDAIKGVHHVGLTVASIDDTLAYYSRAVPFTLVERKRLKASALPPEILAKRQGEIEIALVRTPTVFLELLDLDPARKAPPERRPATGPGYTHVCWQTGHADPGYARFKKLGMAMLSRGDGPVDLGGYGITYAYGFDPDGIMIEMEQVAQPARQDSAWLSHVANVAGDKAAMVAFYTEVLGFGPRRSIPPTSRPTFDMVVDIDQVELEASWFTTANLDLEFWHYTKPKTPLAFTERRLDAIGYNSIGFEVADLDATVARLTPQGVRFAGRAFELGGWKIRYARDPEGNLVAFQQNVKAGAARSMDAMRWREVTRP